MSAGKRAGARRAAKPRRSFSPPALLHSLGVTACVIAWGYLVYAAIDFGTSARSGTPSAWWLLALATLGAVACLFAGLLLVARLLRILGITPDPTAEVAAMSAPRTSSPEVDSPSTASSSASSAAASASPTSPREPSYAAAIGDLTSGDTPPITRRPPGHRRATR